MDRQTKMGDYLSCCMQLKMIRPDDCDQWMLTLLRWSYQEHQPKKHQNQLGVHAWVFLLDRKRRECLAPFKQVNLDPGPSGCLKMRLQCFELNYSSTLLFCPGYARCHIGQVSQYSILSYHLKIFYFLLWY